MQTHVVTGAAGFIGSHLVEALLDRGHRVVGLDACTAGYDPRLHDARLGRFDDEPRFEFHQVDVADDGALAAALDGVRPASIVHLAARAGVRASVAEPAAFVRANVLGFTNVLEAARRLDVPHLLYASSASVYGGLEKVPFAPHDPVGHPLSVYAATKRSDELLAHAYSHLHELPTTGLRFFTVYGPWGRPDMAYWRFAEAILTGTPIPVYGDGTAVRDLTEVRDVVGAVAALLDRPPTGDPTWSASSPDAASSAAPYALHNIGRGEQVSVLDLVHLLEEHLGVAARVEHLPPQPGDVPRTWSDTTSLDALVGPRPSTPVRDGIARFAAWFRPWFEEHGPIA